MGEGSVDGADCFAAVCCQALVLAVYSGLVPLDIHHPPPDSQTAAERVQLERTLFVDFVVGALP